MLYIACLKKSTGKRNTVGENFQVLYLLQTHGPLSLLILLNFWGGSARSKKELGKASAGIPNTEN